MAKIELRGIVKEVTKVEHIGAGGQTRKQSLILFVPGYVDQFGEKRGEDEEWSLDIFNNKIEQFALNDNLIDKKVVCIVYVNSRCVKLDDGREFYNVNSNLANISLFEPNSPTQPEKRSW